MSLLEHEQSAEYDEPGGTPDTPAVFTEPADQPALSKMPAPTLWRSANFLKFWAGQSVSKFGDQFNQVAAPLLILALVHTPLALGINDAASLVPYLLLGLPAGALIDRLPRRLTMIVCDLARMLVFALLAALLLENLLTAETIWVIYVATAIASVATIFFDMAYLTAVPTIVRSEQLLTANSAIQVSASTAEFAGPPLAGVVYQAWGAAATMFADALSFAVSVISLLLIPREFRAAPAAAPLAGDVSLPAKPSIVRDIKEGLRFVWGQPVLRWTVLLIAVSNFSSNAIFPLWLFRMRDQLHYSAGIIGVILACMAVGGILGSFVAGKFRRWFGMLPTALVAMLLEALLYGSSAFYSQFWLYMLALFLLGAINVIININILTLRQSITPDHMMGRMQSVARVIAWSLIPAGALLGTAMAGPFGLPPVIIGAGALIFLVALGMFLSPIRKMG